LFGGRRWRVLQVDERAKIIEVVPAQGGRAPVFAGSGGLVHRRIHEEMYRLYTKNEVPVYLDTEAKCLFGEGRREFSRYRVGAQPLIASEDGTVVFLWAGDLVSNTLLVHLQSLGFTGMSFGVGILVEDIAPALLRRKFEDLAQAGPTDPVVLADSVPNRVTDRYDSFLPPDLLSENYASGALDSIGEWNAIRHLVACECLAESE